MNADISLFRLFCNFHYTTKTLLAQNIAYVWLNIHKFTLENNCLMFVFLGNFGIICNFYEFFSCTNIRLLLSYHYNVLEGQSAYDATHFICVLLSYSNVSIMSIMAPLQKHYDDFKHWICNHSNVGSTYDDKYFKQSSNTLA